MSFQLANVARHGEIPPASAAHVQRIHVDRKVYDQNVFDAEFGYRSVDSSDSQRVRGYLRKTCACSAVSAKNWFLNRFPIVRCLARYSLKQDFLSDLVAGITVGIMHIPQGLAYALLAGLPPVYGLYTSFFPSLLYTFFGTSGHISLGALAILSLLTGSVRNRLVPEDLLLSKDFSHSSSIDHLSTNSTMGVDKIDPVPIVTALALMVGVFQVIFGVCQAGFMVLYMSEQVIAGYTTGAGVIIFASQFEKLFGVKLAHPHEGFMAAYYTFQDVFLALPGHINWVTTGISAACILVIGIVKIFVNDRYKKKLRVPVPVDIIVIIIVTLISYFCNLATNQKVKTVREVPTGFPLPRLPGLSCIPKLLPDAFVIAVIGYVESISMAQMFAKRHRYKIDPNQEFYAYGILNIVGSFFGAYPAAAAISRSSVQESAGSKTQITSAIAASLVLVVILWLGHLFEPLPLCVLSAVIIVALKNVLLQILDTRRLWNMSKVDCVIYLVSFLATVICGPQLGLLISVVFAVLTIVVRSQRPKSMLLGHIPNTELYTSLDKYEKIQEFSALKIYRFNTALHFANADLFRAGLYRCLGFDFHDLMEKRQQNTEKLQQNSGFTSMLSSDSGTGFGQRILTSKWFPFPCNKPNRGGRSGSREALASLTCCPVTVSNNNESGVKSDPKVQQPRQIDLVLPSCVIIDCGGFDYVDLTGAHVLVQVYRELKELDISVLLAGCQSSVHKQLNSGGFFKDVPRTVQLVSVPDAVATFLSTPNAQPTLQTLVINWSVGSPQNFDLLL